MWKLLPWSGRGASGYPQRQCFFCCTTSIILPPYKPDTTSSDGLNRPGNPQFSPLPNLATSSTTTISTGTPTNWFCSSCHCQNVATEDGVPVEQYTRPMWDEAWNHDRSQFMRHTRPHISGTKASMAVPADQRPVFSGNVSAGQDGFTFCHTCQTNQVLTLHMLADYLPGEDDPEYQQKLEHLHEYEASIATRYPAVCSDCAPKVQKRITERDQFARSWSLGKWLDLKKKASKTDLANRSGSTSLATAGSPAQTAPVVELQSALHRNGGSGVMDLFRNAFNLESGSTFSMAVLVLTNVGMWSIYVATFLHTCVVTLALQEAAKRVKMEPMSLFSAMAVGLTLFCLPRLLLNCSRIDPLKRSVEKARARQIRVEVKGVALWRTTQLVIVILRLCVVFLAVCTSVEPGVLTYALNWLEAATGKDAMNLLRLAALSVLSSELGLTGLATFQLRVRPPTPLQLVSRPVVANRRHGKPYDVGSDPLLTGLSLDDQVSRPSSAFKQTNGLAQLMYDSHTDKGTAILPELRDADGDAVMEDAATYSARRMSQSSDDDWERGSPRIPQPPASAWTQHGPEAPQQPGSLSSSFNAVRSGGAVDRNGAAQRSRGYKDFELGPQRFWEPQKPTGLEDVFGRAVSLDDRPQRNEHEHNEGDASGRWSKWFGFT